MSVTAEVCCDGCGTLGHAERTARAARAQLREFGWRTALPGGRDLCPECAEKENERGE